MREVRRRARDSRVSDDSTLLDAGDRRYQTVQTMTVAQHLNRQHHRPWG